MATLGTVAFVSHVEAAGTINRNGTVTYDFNNLAENNPNKLLKFTYNIKGNKVLSGIPVLGSSVEYGFNQTTSSVENKTYENYIASAGESGNGSPDEELTQYSYGGVFFNDDTGILNLKSVTFVSNQASFGASVANNAGTINVEGSTFEGNVSGVGGAIFNQNYLCKQSVSFDFGMVDDGVFDAKLDENNPAKGKYGKNGYHDHENEKTASLIIKSSTFKNNEASHASAVYNWSGNMESSGTTYVGNHADLSGGAIRNGGGGSNELGTLDVANASHENDTFISNTSDGTGGAIHNRFGSVLNLLGGNTFDGNTAQGNGGAIYNGGELSLSGDQTFDSNKSKEGNGGAIYNASNAVITVNGGGQTFKGNSAQSGGAIYNLSSFEVINGTVNFTDNQAIDGSGGAIYNEKTVTLLASTFKGNTATSDGGAIYNGGTVGLSSGTFESNKAKSGGAIYNVAKKSEDLTQEIKNLALSSVVFKLNEATESGGALYINGIASINGGTYISNTATSDGGAIYNGGELSLSGDQTFSSNNSTAGNGGAIYNALNTAGITVNGTNQTFTGNSAKSGGAIYNLSSFEVKSGTVNFKNNQAIAGSGGAIYNEKTVTLLASTFEGNTATSDGGAIYNNGTLTLTGSQVFGGEDVSDGNTAQSGGAIYNESGASITANGDTQEFKNNSAQSGGAIYNLSSFEVKSGTVAFTDNQAIGTNTGIEGQGGAIYSEKTVTLLASTFDGNTAQGNGGAIYNGGELSLSGDQTFDSNKSKEGNGGAIYNASNAVITVKVNDESETVSFTGNQATVGSGGAIYNGGTVELSSGTFKSNTAKSGGAIYNVAQESKNLTLSDVIFESNKATYGNGGALHINGIASIDGGTYTSNTAESDGGAIYNNGTLTLTGSQVFGGEEVGNTAQGNGGAIYNESEASITVSGESLEFTNNTAQSGGAVYNLSKFEVESGTVNFTGNQATAGSGGAIYNGGTVKLSSGTFKSNTAKTDGGAIYNVAQKSENLTLSGVSFDANKATKGGAVYINGIASINGGTYTSNTATSDGGAIYNRGTLTLTGSQVFGGDDAGTGNTAEGNGGDDAGAGNTAQGNGGAIYNGGTVKLSSGTFKSNTAKLYGGAIYNESEASITVSGESLEFTNNSAQSGGAVYNLSSFEVEGETVTFTGNQATAGSGGAIYNESEASITVSDDLEFTNNTAQSGGAVYNLSSFEVKTGTVNFIGNQAIGTEGIEGQGGAIYNESEASITVSGESLKFTNNAAQSGGAIYNNGNLTFTGTQTFTGNQATVGSGGYGGAIYNSGTVELSSGTFKSNTAKAGGAIYNNGTLTLTGSQVFGGEKVGNIAQGNGGAIYNKSGASITVSGDTQEFTDNSAKLGGAIANEGIFNLQGTSHTFHSNIANVEGGAIYNSGTINLSGSNEFFGNKAESAPNDIHNKGIFNFGSESSVHIKTTLEGGVTGTGQMYLNQGELHLSENRQIHQGTFNAASKTRTFVTINSNHLVQEKGINHFSDLGDASVTQSKMATVIDRKGYSIHTTGTMSLKSDSVLHVNLKNTDFGKTYLIAYNEDENHKAKPIDNETNAWKGKNITIISTNPMLSFYRVEGDAENGYVMISSEESNSVDVIEDLSSHKPMYYGWLSDLSDLRHRLGEIRYGAQDGLWVKGVYSRYRTSGLGDGSLKTKDYSIHLGLDHQIVENEDKSWLLGMSLKAGRMDLDSNRADGSGDTDHYMLKGYATYFNKSGSYLDVVASLGYFDNEFTGFHDAYSGYMKAEYDNWGYGLSLEAGHMFSWGEDIDDRQWHNHWFFEPQFQLSYLRIQGEEFDTSVGIHVDQKNTNYLTGRLGGVFGKKFNYGDENSLDKRFLQIGARAGWIHEFKGDQSLKMNGVKYTGKTTDDVFYYGLDVDWQFGQNQKCYLQVDRAHGSGYRKEVQVRLGYRYEF